MLDERNKTGLMKFASIIDYRKNVRVIFEEYLADVLDTNIAPLEELDWEKLFNALTANTKKLKSCPSLSY